MYERFAIFQKPIALDNGKVEIIVLAACALHIFFKEQSARTCTCRQAALIRRIWKVTLQSMVIGALALIPRVTSLVYQVSEETGQI